jgi:hypothetical protein
MHYVIESCHDRSTDAYDRPSVRPSLSRQLTICFLQLQWFDQDVRGQLPIRY